MSIQFPVVILLTIIPAATMPTEENIRVDVYINDRDDSTLRLGPGALLASNIFEKIGVHLNWRTGEVPTAQSAAGNVTSQIAFGIRTLQHAPESAAPDALASARIVDWSRAEMTLYRDRLQRFLECHPSLPGVAVAGAGYILAHELAHVMQGIPRHSEIGILKVKWSNADIENMIFHTLVFTAFDVELIHQGLALQRQRAVCTGGRR
jgi:hypothetical protein